MRPHEICMARLIAQRFPNNSTLKEYSSMPPVLPATPPSSRMVLVTVVIQRIEYTIQYA